MSGVAGSDPCAWAESHASRRGVRGEVGSEKEACHVTSHYLWSMSEECLDDVAMVFYNGPEVTYRDLQERTKKVVLMLQGLGLKKGDVVSAQLPNWEEFAYINLACCTLGLVFNPIIPIYRGKELSFILADAGTKLLFIPDEYRSMGYIDMVKELAPKIESLEHVVVLRSEDTSKLDGIFKSYELLVQGVDQSSEFSIPESPDADHVKLLMYTSGTTGTPKGVLHSHRTMATVVGNVVNFREVDESDVYYMPSPLTHITGYSACEMIVRTSLHKTVIQDKWNKADAVDFILKTGATFTVGATPFLVEILDECRSRKETLPSLKSFACGGASVPPELIRSVSDVLENCQAFRVYGSTEVPLVSQGLTARSQLERAATTDGCIYNYDVKVIDESGDDVTAGERDGELLVKGPGMLLGYTSLEQTEKAFDASGYFHTGDIGHVSSNDDIVITDRMKDIIIRGGENISAKEVEDVLHEHENIREAAVVSQPNERLGEGVCAFIIPASDAALILEEVNQYLREKGLAKQKQLENMIIVDSFERTASGKIRKDILRNITWKK
jgi:acyl-CoA synthetase